MNFKKYALPPEMYEFERDGLFVFYDPVNFVWFRTDALGKTLVDVLARGGDGQEAASEVARLSGAPLEIASGYVEGSLRKLLGIGFLHEGEYVPSRSRSGPHGWAPLPAERIVECFSCSVRHVCPGGCRLLLTPREDIVKGRELCPAFFDIAVDRLWTFAALP